MLINDKGQHLGSSASFRSHTDFCGVGNFVVEPFAMDILSEFSILLKSVIAQITNILVLSCKGITSGRSDEKDYKLSNDNKLGLLLQYTRYRPYHCNLPLCRPGRRTRRLSGSSRSNIWSRGTSFQSSLLSCTQCVEVKFIRLVLPVTYCFQHYTNRSVTNSYISPIYTCRQQ